MLKRVVKNHALKSLWKSIYWNTRKVKLNKNNDKENEKKYLAIWWENDLTSKNKITKNKRKKYYT